MNCLYTSAYVAFKSYSPRSWLVIAFFTVIYIQCAYFSQIKHYYKSGRLSYKHFSVRIFALEFIHVFV